MIEWIREIHSVRKVDISLYDNVLMIQAYCLRQSGITLPICGDQLRSSEIIKPRSRIWDFLVMVRPNG